MGTEIEVTGRRARCRIPDLMVHSEESRIAFPGTKRAILTRDLPPPALVVEVVSPGVENRDQDYRHKHTGDTPIKSIVISGFDLSTAHILSKGQNMSGLQS